MAVGDPAHPVCGREQTDGAVGGSDGHGGEGLAHLGDGRGPGNRLRLGLAGGVVGGFCLQAGQNLIHGAQGGHGLLLGQAVFHTVVDDLAVEVQNALEVLLGQTRQAAL